MHYKRLLATGTTDPKEKPFRYPCAVEHCGRPSIRLGDPQACCRKHEQRKTRNGDPFLVKGYHGVCITYFRDVVLKYNGNECLIWPFFRNATGYGMVGIGGRMSLVHRETCKFLNGPPPDDKPHACHTCGNGHLGCCAPNHTEWGNPRKNSLDRIKHGTVVRGEDVKISKLTEAQVFEIRELSKSASQKELAKLYGVNPSTISLIKSRKIWGWL